MRFILLLSLLFSDGKACKKQNKLYLFPATAKPQGMQLIPEGALDRTTIQGKDYIRLTPEQYKALTENVPLKQK